MSIAKKGTLLIVSGPSHDPSRKHLHVICSDPDHERNVLIVGICSVSSAPHDDTCILQPHEHDFLSHDSYVLYARAQIVPEQGLNLAIENKSAIVHKAVNSQTFLRIKKGICRSPHASRKVKRYAGCDAVN